MDVEQNRRFPGRLGQLEALRELQSWKVWADLQRVEECCVENVSGHVVRKSLTRAILVVRKETKGPPMSIA